MTLEKPVAGPRLVRLDERIGVLAIDLDAAVGECPLRETPEEIQRLLQGRGECGLFGR